jgi:transposase
VLIGVDYHPSFQQIAFFDEETGECGERQLKHSDGEAERFYRDLQKRGIRVRVGMGATGCSRLFERLLAELGIEIRMGDSAEIKAKRVKKRETDRNDALLLLRPYTPQMFTGPNPCKLTGDVRLSRIAVVPGSRRTRE